MDIRCYLKIKIGRKYDDGKYKSVKLQSNLIGFYVQKRSKQSVLGLKGMILSYTIMFMEYRPKTTGY